MKRHFIIIASMIVLSSLTVYAGKPELPKVSRVSHVEMAYQPGWIKKQYRRCGNILGKSPASIKKLKQICAIVTALRSGREKKKFLRDVLKTLPRK